MPKKIKMTTDIPNSITTPAKIDTRLGALWSACCILWEDSTANAGDADGNNQSCSAASHQGILLTCDHKSKYANAKYCIEHSIGEIDDIQQLFIR